MKCFTFLRFFVVAVVVVAGLILLVAIIKFNILNDDVYVVQADGNTIQMNLISHTSYLKFACANGLSGKIDYVFLKDGSIKAFLTLPHKIAPLKHVPTDSGLKFTSQDQSVVFWEKEKQAIILENGKITHNACKISPLEPS